MDSLPPSHRSTAAQRLDADILWYIFLIIVETDFKERTQKIPTFIPLTVLHQSSQVCRRWREVLIDSCGPLWGKAIHADLLVQKDGRWRDEILKRAGSSILWVAGMVSIDDSISAVVFNKSLRDLWPRIQRFALATDSGGVFPDEAWKGLDYPAPYLECFSFQLDPWARRIDTPTLCTLFANTAPLLRQFSCPCGGAEFIKMEWFIGLQNLNISLYDMSSVSAFLHTAPNMTRLKELTLALNLSFPSELYAVFPPQSVLIPSLSKIHLSPYLPSASTFLDIVVPHAGCLLHASLQSSGISRTNTMLQRILSRYGASYLRSRVIEGLILYISCGKFAIGELELQATSDYDFHIGGSDHDAEPSMPNMHLDMELLISALPLEALSNVTRLRLDVGINFCDLDGTPLAKLLSSLDHVEEMTSPFRILFFFSSLPPTTTPLFPRLHTFKVRRETRVPNGVKEALVSFFESRQRAGIPIETFDITYASETVPSQLPDLTFLENYRGLTIWWGEENSRLEYVCGNGNIEAIE